MAAVDLVGPMKNAEDLFVKMKIVAEATENIWTERIALIANDNSWTGICIEIEKLGDLLIQGFFIGEKIENCQKRFDDYSTKFKNLKKCVALLRKADSRRKLQKKKIKLEYLVKEEEIKISERIGASDDEIIKKKAELKTSKHNLDVAGEILKLVKDAGQLREKACDMVKEMFILQVRTFQADFVEVVDRTDVSVINRMCEMSPIFKGVTLKFAIGKLAQGETLEYICANISDLSEFCAKLSRLGEVAIDVKPGYLYELSVDSKGLCHFRQLTPV